MSVRPLTATFSIADPTYGIYFNLRLAKRGMKTHRSTSDRRVSWSSCLLMFKADDSIHSLLIICSFCEDVWEADGASVTALSGLRGQMDAMTCFHTSGSERNLASNFKSSVLGVIEGEWWFQMFTFFPPLSLKGFMRQAKFKYWSPLPKTDSAWLKNAITIVCMIKVRITQS